MDVRDELLAIERRLWTNDAPFYEGALLPEALLVFPETGVIGRDVALREIRRENAEGRRWAQVEFEDVHCVPLADDVALVTYRVTARWADETTSSTALASSVYAARGGGWKLAFHQQTPVGRG
jgi:hypothetical protein